jgi:hypothetical protein
MAQRLQTRTLPSISSLTSCKINQARRVTWIISRRGIRPTLWISPSFLCVCRVSDKLLPRLWAYKSDFIADLKQPLPSIIHYSAGEPFTKYEICLIFAQILGLDHGHIIPQPEPPSGESRPQPLSYKSLLYTEISHGSRRWYPATC